MYDKFFVGGDLTGAENNGKQPPISRVTLLLDDNNAVTAGDDTGMELVADCPHATQEMVNAILERVKGHQYQMYSAENANIDPAAELGDGVTVDGMYSVVSRVDDDGSGYAGLSAPGEAELEDEYPATGPTTQMFNRKIAQTNSRITKTAEQIRLEVANEVRGLSASIDIQLDSITNRVEDAESGLSQTLRIAADGVTITNASGSKLTIDGGQIDASRINTAQLDASRINTADLQLTGVITWGDLDASTRNSINNVANTANNAANTASSAYSAAVSASNIAASAQSTVSSWQYYGSTYIDGSKLMTGTVKASTIQGGAVYLLDYSGNYAGALTLTGASSAGYAVDLTSYGAMRLHAQSGDVYIYSSQYNHYLWVSSEISVNGPFVSRNVSSLGTSVFKWSDVYANNAAIQTSDLTVKRDVEYGLDGYDALFDALRPMSFLFEDGESGRRHLGLGAQDVEAAMEAAGVSDMEFAGFIKSPKPDGEGFIYGLRYGEFIPLCIEQIQRLKSRVDKLERGTPN